MFPKGFQTHLSVTYEGTDEPVLLYRDPKQLCVGGQPGNPNGQTYIESWHKTLRARLRIQFDAAALFSTFVNVYSLILRLRVQQAIFSTLHMMMLLAMQRLECRVLALQPESQLSVTLSARCRCG